MLNTLLSSFIIFFIIYGIEGFGVSPEELFVRVNDSFKLSCTVEEADGELNFYDNDELVSSSNIKRVNDTFIEMTMLYTRPVKKNFTCKQDHNNVGLSEVFVDERMAPVVDFKCRTSDLTNLLCSFRKPVAFLPIKYRFSFAVNDETTYQSKAQPDGKGGYSSEIKVPESSKSLSEISFGFILHASNRFYRLDERFNKKLLEMLVPKEVEDLRVMDELTTHNTALVTFALPKELNEASHEILFDIRLKLADDKASKWKRIENPRLQMMTAGGYLGIDNLDYANTNYVVKIRMKANAAEDVDEMWSKFKEVSFKTKGIIPVTTPSTCANCFNVMDNGNVVIYWMAVPSHHQNADDFSYLVRGWNENGIELIHHTLSTNSMVLQNNLEAESLKIEVYSKNSKGISKSSSQLYVPLKRLQSNKKSLKVHKELLTEFYKITWKQIERLDVESFTIFWCHQRNELPNQCDGSINFQNLPSNVTEFTLEASKSSQFGVASNFHNNSIVQGFEWAECTAAKPNEIGQVHSMWSSVASERSITVHWKLNCADEPIVAGYNFTYCLLDDDDPTKCAERMNEKIELLGNVSEMNQFSILGLKSYRLYNVSISLMSHSRLGILKAPISVRTLEGAPTAPRNLKAIKIDRHSIDLTWNRPHEVNGESMTYQLWYNDQKININDNNTMNETFAFKLVQLESFSNYTITIVACTSGCSESSDSLTLRTAMSEPSAMDRPTLKKIDDEKKIVISWKPPQLLGGNLDYYQLMLVMSNAQGIATEKVYRLNGQVKSCIIEGFKCEDETVNFFIRSVNVEQVDFVENFINHTVSCFAINEPIHKGADRELYGVWSQPLTFYCLNGYSMALLGLIIAMTIFLVIFVYMFIRLFQKYQKMKDIHTVWPNGFDPSTPIPSELKDSSTGTKDLDLIKDHVLTDIEEEEEFTEREKFVPDSKPEVVVISQHSNDQMLESAKSEIFLPFICNPKTNEIFYEMPKKSVRVEKAKSAPTTPQKIANAYSEFCKDPSVDLSTGYMKMSTPPRVLADITKSVEGYLDMSGKSPPTEKSESKESDYLMHGIKSFIQESESNSGYIGKRASFLMDPCKKHPATIINVNGYVGLPK